MILTRILTLIFVGGFATGAAAKGLSQPWTPAYRGASNAPAQVPQSYADTHYLLSSALLQRVSQAEIAAARGLVDAALLVDPVRLPDGSTLAGLPAATQGTDLYRVSYRSVDSAGKPAVVSGLVAVPQTDASGGIVVYMHATRAHCHGAPSDLPVEAWGALTAFSGNDWVVVMPDYLLEAQPDFVDNLIDKPFFIAFAGVAAAQVTGQPLGALLRPQFAQETAGLLPGTQPGPGAALGSGGREPRLSAPGEPLQTMSHDVGFVPCSILAARSFRVKALAQLPRLADPK